MSKTRMYFVSYAFDGGFGECCVTLSGGWNDDTADEVRKMIEKETGEEFSSIMFFTEIEKNGQGK